MCEQKKVFKKIKEKGRVNGYDLELAEAQMHDYMTLKRDVDSVKESVNAIKMEQAVQGGKLDLIIQRLNSPVEEERKDGIFWYQIKSLFKTTTGKLMVLLLLGSIALAGQRILELIGIIK